MNETPTHYLVFYQAHDLTYGDREAPEFVRLISLDTRYNSSQMTEFVEAASAVLEGERDTGEFTIVAYATLTGWDKPLDAVELQRAFKGGPAILPIVPNMVQVTEEVQDGWKVRSR